MKMYEKSIAPLLFNIEAETAHNLFLKSLSISGKSEIALGLLKGLSYENSPVAKRVGGLRFRHPIGLAAGFDKDGIAISALEALGFAFITIGTVTPVSQPGKPRPRIFRDSRNQALWNRLGFPNKGADAMVERLKKQPCMPIPLGISIGKGVETHLEDAADDYLYCLKQLSPYASFIEVCISSPNTFRLRSLQGGKHLDDLLNRLVDNSYKPLWIKLAPDMKPEALKRAVEICEKYLNPERDAIIMGNSTVDRSVNSDIMKGGYSGRPLFPKALAEVKSIETKLPLVGCGGVFNGRDTFRMLNEGGCELVQIHSAIPYRGPFVAKKILNELIVVMKDK